MRDTETRNSVQCKSDKIQKMTKVKTRNSVQCKSDKIQKMTEVKTTKIRKKLKR